MTETKTWKLTGITKGTGQCDCCSRTLTQRVFQVTHPDHGTRNLGRRCAAKATGYPTTAVERAAATAARTAVIEARRVTIFTRYPEMATAWNTYLEARAAREAAGYDLAYTPQTSQVTRLQTAITSDYLWNDEAWVAYLEAA